MCFQLGEARTHVRVQMKKYSKISHSCSSQWIFYILTRKMIISSEE